MDIRTTAALAVAIFLWSSAFPLIRVGLHAYPPIELAFFRYGIASLVLVILAVAFRVRMPQRRHMARLFLGGFLGVAFYNAALNWGEQTVKAGPAAFIINTLPMFTAILSTIYLRERILAPGWLGLIVSTAGIALIAFGEGDGLSINLHAFAILAAAFAWSVTIIIHKPLLLVYTAFEVVAYTIWSGTLCMVFVLPGVIQAMRTADLAATGAVLYLGIFPAALAYITWTIVLAKLPASRASSFLYLVPVLSTVIGFILLDEKPSLLSLLGGCLALGGVVIINTLGRETRRPLLPSPQPTGESNTA